MIRTQLAAWKLSLLAALFIVVFDNQPLIASLVERLPLHSPAGTAYLLFIAVLMTGVLWATFLVAGAGPLLKPVIALTLLLSAVLAWFTAEIGVVFDLEMLRNLAETLRDVNRQEAAELLSLPLLGHVLLYGVLPAAVVTAVPVRRAAFVTELRHRALCLCTLTVLVALLGLPNYKYVTYFSVENRDLRLQVTPVFAALSLLDLLERRNRDPQREFHEVGNDAVQAKSIARRVVGVMVVGETARADRFSLGSYTRPTNPLLEQQPGLMYFVASSCGTSTAFSVPCMFSLRNREDFSPEQAKFESNVLDVLELAGVRTVWIDNNSSCKNVCNRIEYENLHQAPDPSSPLFSDDAYYDEVLLGELDRYLDDPESDLLIVLHTLGSHGPAYSHRYPERFGVFTPYCDRNSPTECAGDEVSNAYNNTIVYTDYVLSRIVARLEARGGDFDSFMLYASDHGESLGERGVYLHGLPYRLAPAAQTEVPIIVWLSPGIADDYGIDTTSAALQHGERLSHDYISHTLLGLYEVPTEVYRRELDLFGNRGTMLARQAATPRGPASPESAPHAAVQREGFPGGAHPTDRQSVLQE